MKALIGLFFVLFFIESQAQIKLWKEDSDSEDDSTNSYDGNCKPFLSSIDKLTDKTNEFYGGKLETIRSLFSRVEYKNSMFFYWDHKAEKTYLILQVGSKIDIAAALLLRESYNEGSEIGVRAGDEVYWFKVIKVQKGDYISSNFLYSNNYLFCPIELKILKQFQKLGIEAYQYTNSNNEVVQGDLLSGRTSKISDQLTCFIDKYGN